jgi:PD-(D/E)XK endonuclease
MSCASFSSARPAIRRACSSEFRGSWVPFSSSGSVARNPGVRNGHGPADATDMLAEMTTDQKGAIAEACIAAAAVKLGIEVYKPIAEGGRCDLILGVGEQLLKLQCKWAQRQGDVLIVRCYTFRRTRGGYRKTTYTAARLMQSLRTTRTSIAASSFQSGWQPYGLPLRFELRRPATIRSAESTGLTTSISRLHLSGSTGP